jgi:hypothetical protein
MTVGHLCCQDNGGSSFHPIKRAVVCTVTTDQRLTPINNQAGKWPPGLLNRVHGQAVPARVLQLFTSRDLGE